MKKTIGSLGYLSAFASMMALSNPITEFPSEPIIIGTPYRKTKLSNKQKKARAKSKRAKQARKRNKSK